MSAAAGSRVVLALPYLLAGGTELQTLALASVLAAEGWKVAVCCYRDADPQVVSAFERTGARVQRVGLPPGVGLPEVFLRLRAVFRSLRPDVVHVQYLAPGFTAVLAARAAGVRTVLATVHQSGHGHAGSARLLLRGAARLCRSVFTVSFAVERSWFGNAAVFDPAAPAAREHATIYNCVDSAAIASAVRGVDRGLVRRALGIPADAAVVGYLGRLRREKGLDVLLRALPSVCESFPAARLVVVGDGPEAGALRGVAADAGVSECVVWVGRRSQQEAWRLLPAMDAVAVPSRCEGFGLAAAEAQAAGLPVVASDVGGLPEVVRDGEGGILVGAESQSMLAGALCSLLGDRDRALRMGRAGQRHVAQSFSRERFSASIAAAYRLHAAPADAARRVS